MWYATSSRVTKQYCVCQYRSIGMHFCVFYIACLSFLHPSFNIFANYKNTNKNYLHKNEPRAKNNILYSIHKITFVSEINGQQFSLVTSFEYTWIPNSVSWFIKLSISWNNFFHLIDQSNNLDISILFIVVSNQKYIESQMFSLYKTKNFAS